METGSAAATIAGNSLINNDLGIDLLDPNVTIKNTQFYGVTTSTAINFECNLPAAISGNSFVGASVALSNVGNGAPISSTAGTYFGVQTIETPCL